METPTYSNEDLQKALKAINRGTPLSVVSREFNIPKSTLFDKKKGISKPAISRRGPESILGDETEERLIEWIFYMSEQGFPVTKEQLLNSVQRLMKTMAKNNVFINNRPRKHWFYGFKKRHPEICEKFSENMTYTRAAVTEEKLRQWFEKVKMYLVSKNLLHIDPSRIYNYDESPFRLCPQGQKVLTKKGDRSAYNFVNNNDKECVTVLFCGNAAGQVLPPMIMYNYV